IVPLKTPAGDRRLRGPPDFRAVTAQALQRTRSARRSPAMPLRTRAGAPAATFACLRTGGCTPVKPVVGAVAGPAVLLSGTGSCFCRCDGRAAVAVLGVAAAAGAVVGLVTGIVSDVQALSGEAEDPTANWWDPFKTNTSPVAC